MAFKTQRISVEIDSRTLRRLLADEQLNIRQFTCNDHNSKDGVQRILLSITAKRL